jgi:hypothetical protein
MSDQEQPKIPPHLDAMSAILTIAIIAGRCYTKMDLASVPADAVNVFLQTFDSANTKIGDLWGAYTHLRRMTVGEVLEVSPEFATAVTQNVLEYGQLLAKIDSLRPSSDNECP